MSSESEPLTAEQRFRQAFERLKSNAPKILKPDTPVSQNNVAKEAGCDPSALRKARFPTLIREIQTYVEIHQQEQPSARQQRLKQRKVRTEFGQRIQEVVAQRDDAQSKLVGAHRAVLELLEENARLKARLEHLTPLVTPLPH